MKVAISIRQLQEEIKSTPSSSGWAAKFLGELATMIESEVDASS